eukprot:1033946-Rhodomonas_salina.1
MPAQAPASNADGQQGSLDLRYGSTAQCIGRQQQHTIRQLRKARMLLLLAYALGSTGGAGASGTELQASGTELQASGTELAHAAGPTTTTRRLLRSRT